MGNVLQFVPRGTPGNGLVPLPSVIESQHLPGVDAGLRRNPGATGGDHMTPEVDLTEAPGAPASMRRVLSLRCKGCGHEWLAPNVGSCVRCGWSGVTALTEKKCVLPRV